MEFFDKQKDNSKQNEMLLDAIMEKQRQREKKYNVDKGFLIRKNEKVNNHYVGHLNNKQGNANVDHREPMFVVGHNKKHKTKKSCKKLRFLQIFMIVSFCLIGITGIFCSAFFLTRHNVEIVCGNMDGIIITDKKGKKITKLTPRINETVEFKIELNPEYSDSDIQVVYGETELISDVYKIYTFKYTGKDDTIRIMGVAKNKYKIEFANDNYFSFKVQDNNGQWNTTINGKTINDFYNETLKFKIYAEAKQEFVTEPYVSVYVDKNWCQANEDGEYELNFLSHQQVTIVNGSPMEYFKYTEILKSNGTLDYYRVTGLTDIGNTQKTLVFPSIFYGVQIHYNFSYSEFYNNVTEITIPDSIYINDTNNYVSFCDQFDQFQNLEYIHVDSYTHDIIKDGLISIDGILYYHRILLGTRNSNNLLKCPTSYGKSLPEGQRVLTINPNIISTRAFNRIDYIRTIIIGNKLAKIDTYAFKYTNAGNYDIVFNNNPNFKIVNNVIYNYNGTTIVASPFASGVFHVADGMKVLNNAFSNSNITSLIFDGTATLYNSSIADMVNVKNIVFPSNFEEILFETFGLYSQVEVLDFRNVSLCVKISDDILSYMGWDSVKSIVVPDDLYEDYKTTYNGKAFADKFISVTDYDEQ